MASLEAYLSPVGWLATGIRPIFSTISLSHVVVTFAALMWLVHRTWQVLRIPLPELVDLLGLEIPQAPDVSLAGVSFDNITLHWTRPDHHTSVVKHLIQVNGIIVGESSRLETAITVSGLKPDHFYNVRVIAVNVSNFQAASSVIRLKTLREDEVASPSSTVDLVLDPPNDHARAVPHGSDARLDRPGIRAHGTVAEHNSPSIAATMTKDRTSGVHHGRRMTGIRKSSPGGTAIDSTSSAQNQPVQGPSNTEGSLSEQTVQQLTERHDIIRQEMREIRLLKAKEEQEFLDSKESLVRERDRLKQAVKEKEDASAELRKEVASLDRQNRAAQTNKASKERILQQKQNERKKIQQDIQRWDKEGSEYGKEIEKLKKRKMDIVGATEEKIKDIRGQIHEWQSSIKSMEEEIRERGTQIKELEEERQKIQLMEGDTDVLERERLERQTDVWWDIRLRELQSFYAKGLHSVQQAQESHRQAQERLTIWKSRGITSPSQFATMALYELEALTSNRANHFKHRHSRSRTNTLPSPMNNLSPDVRFSLPQTGSIPPFFNINNGTVTQVFGEPASMTSEEIDLLTDGARMSPTANALIPSNLLGDEESSSPRIGSIGENLMFGLTAFPRAAQPEVEGFRQEPNSPESTGSKAASNFSSPKSSLNHLPLHAAGSEVPIDSERLSQHSFRAPIGTMAGTDSAAPAPRRFPNIFNLNLNRQRNKAVLAEPPALGTLKAGQSQSFPRNWEQPTGKLDPIGTRRRRGSYSASWASPVTNFNFLTRSVTADVEDENEQALGKTSANRRRALNMFGSKYNPIDPVHSSSDTSSIRPSSMSSFDNVLPLPSTDNQPFGWPVPNTSHPGPDWSVRSGDPWSNTRSRRGSVTHDSTGSLSMGISPVDADSSSSSQTRETSQPAPIGTKPKKSPKPPAPTLNPAAPSFRTIFSRNDAKKAEKADKIEKAAELEREKEKERERDRDFDSINEEFASQKKHTSRDTRSVHTEESWAESRDSFDQLASTGPSDGVTASGAPTKDKESIFQRIGRKGSYSKFNVPWKEKGGLFNKKTAESFPHGDTDEGTSAESQHGRSVESVTSSPSMTGGKGSRSWSTLIRRSRKGDRAADEVAGKTSETGGEDSDGTSDN